VRAVAILAVAAVSLVGTFAWWRWRRAVVQASQLTTLQGAEVIRLLRLILWELRGEGARKPPAAPGSPRAGDSRRQR